MTSFKKKRPSNIKLPEHSLVPTLKKLEILQQHSSKLRKLLQVCENEKSSLNFEIAILNKKVTRIANEKRDVESQLYMTPSSGKKRKTRKSKRKAGGAIPPLHHEERKAKLSDYIRKLYNKQMDYSEIIPFLGKTEFNEKDHHIMLLGIIQFLKDLRDNSELSITDNYIGELLAQAKNKHEAGKKSKNQKKSKKIKKSKKNQKIKKIK